MHNDIMAAGSKEHPPMLDSGSYAQWKSRSYRDTITPTKRRATSETNNEGPYIMTKSHIQKLLEDGERPRLQVHEIHAEENCKNAKPSSLVATTQNSLDDYYQAPPTPKPYKPHAPSSRQTSTRSHATTRNKGKEIVKAPSPLTESGSEEDIDEEQAQRDKQIHKSLALIARNFKNIYKPTNNNLKTSSNTRNKNVDTSPRTRNDKKTRQFGNQGTVTVAGNKVHPNDDYNVFATKRLYYKQPESITETYMVETVDTNVIPDSSDMCYNEEKADQNAEEPEDELISYIAKEKEQLKKDFKEHEDKDIDKQIALENQFKLLRNNEKVLKSTNDSPIIEHNCKMIEINDLKAQLQDKTIVNAEMRALLNKAKEKSMDTKFVKPYVVRKPNAFKFQKPLVLGKPSPFANSLERQSFPKSWFVPKTQRTRIIKPVSTPQILP
ncbi:hypothetical protein Tco_0955674 [Tanacetum coccineum]|uniref:Uncharacterized protein n=1 Tax=Tanacetum coccineum TaxID=301880 RepID=A0ABQ5E803_9ASTR